MVNADYAEKALQYTKQVLDGIDIKQFAIAHPEIKTIYGLISCLEDEYVHLANNEYMEGILFNWMSCDEFETYLHTRYPLTFKLRQVTVPYIQFKQLDNETN